MTRLGAGVAGGELDPAQAAGGEVAGERKPAGDIVAGGDLHAKDLAVSVGVTPVATRTWTGTARPPSRTSGTRASAATSTTGQVATTDRARNSSTCASKTLRKLYAPDGLTH